MNNSKIIKDTVTLYHGSKSGIHGMIAPVSRERCDFGRGFYMGTDRTQPLTLICNYPNAKLYTLCVDLSGLKILNVEMGIDWALIDILDEQAISEADRDKLKQENEVNRSKGIAMAEEICRKYRREGRFFDEILKAGG